MIWTIVTSILMIFYILVVLSVFAGPFLLVIFKSIQWWIPKKWIPFYTVNIYPWYIKSFKYQFINKWITFKRIPRWIRWKIQASFKWIGMKIYWMRHSKELERQDSINYYYRIGHGNKYMTDDFRERECHGASASQSVFE